MWEDSMAPGRLRAKLRNLAAVILRSFLQCSARHWLHFNELDDHCAKGIRFTVNHFHPELAPTCPSLVFIFWERSIICIVNIGPGYIRLLPRVSPPPLLGVCGPEFFCPVLNHNLNLGLLPLALAD